MSLKDSEEEYPPEGMVETYKHNNTQKLCYLILLGTGSHSEKKKIKVILNSTSWEDDVVSSFDTKDDTKPLFVYSVWRLQYSKLARYINGQCRKNRN